MDNQDEPNTQEHFYKEQISLLNRELQLKHEQLNDMSQKYLALLQETKASELKSAAQRDATTNSTELLRITQLLQNANQSITAKENYINHLEEEVRQLKAALN